MHPALEYALLTIKHKWFVLVAGLRLRVPIFQLLLHDWSKFFLAGAYGAVMFTSKRYRDDEDYERFARAWLYHQNHEPHHWEYWIPRTVHGLAGGELTPIRMPERYVREMVADWLAASRVYEGKWPSDAASWSWFRDNRGKVTAHPETAIMIDCLLKQYFEGGDTNECGY